VIEFLIILARIFYLDLIKYLICIFLVESTRFLIYATRFFSSVKLLEILRDKKMSEIYIKKF